MEPVRPFEHGSLEEAWQQELSQFKESPWRQYNELEINHLSALCDGDVPE